MLLKVTKIGSKIHITTGCQSTVLGSANNHNVYKAEILNSLYNREVEKVKNKIRISEPYKVKKLKLLRDVTS